MSILIQKPGILTTIQDLGRYKYRRFGINPGGAMDHAAVRLINILLGNQENEAVIEMHFPAPQILFYADTAAAIGGGDFDTRLDDKSVENWRSFRVKKGSILKFDKKSSGNRSYLAVRGGFETDRWLDSSSTNLAAKMGGFNGRKLEDGDRIDLRQFPQHYTQPASAKIAPSIIPQYAAFPTVRIIRGAEYCLLSEHGRDLLCNQNFLISKYSDRMGFRLTGKPVMTSKKCELISSAVSFGTIQALPDGQLTVLMADHQTAGGYPRIGHIISRDLPLIAQLGTNDKVAFHMVNHEEAENLALEFERELNILKASVSLNIVVSQKNSP